MAKVTITFSDSEADSRKFNVLFDTHGTEVTGEQATESPSLLMMLLIQNIIRDAAAVESIHPLGEAHKC